MVRFNSLASTLLVASSLLAAGCDEDPVEVIPPSAPAVIRFAQATPAQRDAALTAALGRSARRGVESLYFAQADHEADSTCPARQVAGDQVTYTSNGCTGGSGLVYTGAARAKNSPVTGDFVFIEDERDARPSEIVFADYAVELPDGVLRLDGTIRQSQAAPKGNYTLDVQLAIDDGVRLNLSQSMSCDDVACDAQVGSKGSIVGKGDFTIQAHVPHTGASGHVTLRGQDELTLELDTRDEAGCAVYRIDGRLAGSFCARAELNPPVKARTHVLTPALIDALSFASIRCGSGSIDPTLTIFSNETTQDIARVDTQSLVVTLKLGDRQEVVSLRSLGYAVSLGGSFSVSSFFGEFLTPGEDTSFTCAEAARLGVRFDVGLQDAQHFCLLAGDVAQFPDAADCGR